MKQNFRKAAMLVCGAMMLVVSACSNTTLDPVSYRYEVPLGAVIGGGEGLGPPIFPSDLQVRVGDSLTIVNNDDLDQSIGPYFVSAGGSITQTFNVPGVLQGDCVFTETGTYKITVSEA